MAAITDLTKPAQKIARSYGSQIGSKIRKQVKETELINAGVGLGATLAGAFVDHKWRTGAESEARFGQPGAKFRPQVNAVIGAAGIVAGIMGVGGRRYSSSVLSAGVGLASPALYNFTRRQLAK